MYSRPTADHGVFLQGAPVFLLPRFTEVPLTRSPYAPRAVVLTIDDEESDDPPTTTRFEEEGDQQQDSAAYKDLDPIAPPPDVLPVVDNATDEAPDASGQGEDAPGCTELSIVERVRHADYVVFSGGAVKGVAMWSAYACICDTVRHFAGRDLLAELKGAAGTSIGSILAFACCATRDIDTVTALITRESFWDGSVISRHMDPARAYYTRGLVPHDALYRNIDEVFRVLGVDKGVTFEEFYNWTGGKEFVCNTACVTAQTSVLFSHRRTPHRSVREALAMSMCVPGIFTPFVRHEEVFVDGGVYDNFLMHAFPAGTAIGISAEQPRLNYANYEQQNIVQFFVSVSASVTSLMQAARTKAFDPASRRMVIDVFPPSEVTTAQIIATPIQIRALWRAGIMSALWFLVKDLYVPYVLRQYISRRIDEAGGEPGSEKVRRKLRADAVLRRGSHGLLDDDPPTTCADQPLCPTSPSYK